MEEEKREEEQIRANRETTAMTIEPWDRPITPVVHKQQLNGKTVKPSNNGKCTLPSSSSSRTTRYTLPQTDIAERFEMTTSLTL